ncbi:MAG: hypothetical protein ACK55Z_15590, partial [bacterium]
MQRIVCVCVTCVRVLLSLCAWWLAMRASTTACLPFCLQEKDIRFHSMPQDSNRIPALTPSSSAPLSPHPLSF